MIKSRCGIVCEPQVCKEAFGVDCAGCPNITQGEKMKQIKRIGYMSLGFFPLLLFGYYLNHLILTTFYYVVGPYFFIGVVIIAVWFIFGMISVLFVSSAKEAVLLLNAPAFLFLLLLLFQAWVLESMWLNQIGFATQMFFLPLFRFGFVMAGILPRFILPIVDTGIAGATAFVFMVAASYFGRSFSERISSNVALRCTK